MSVHEAFINAWFTLLTGLRESVEETACHMVVKIKTLYPGVIEDQDAAVAQLMQIYDMALLRTRADLLGAICDFLHEPTSIPVRPRLDQLTPVVGSGYEQ